MSPRQASGPQSEKQFVSSCELTGLFEWPGAMNRSLRWRHWIAPAPRLNPNSLGGLLQTISKPTQKIRALTHEARVGRFHAVDETDQLRHDEREHGQRQHRNEKLSQIDAARNRSSALQHAKAADRLLEQRAALGFGDALSTATVDRLPFHQAHEVDIRTPGQVDMRERTGEVAGCRFDQSGALVDFAAQDFAIEVLLGAEAVIEHSLVYAGAPGDRVDSRAGEAARREFGECGGEDLLARAAEVADRCASAGHASRSLTVQLIVLLTDRLIKPSHFASQGKRHLRHRLECVKGGVLRCGRNGRAFPYHFSFNGRTSTSGV